MFSGVRTEFVCNKAGNSSSFCETMNKRSELSVRYRYNQKNYEKYSYHFLIFFFIKFF